MGQAELGWIAWMLGRMIVKIAPPSCALLAVAVPSCCSTMRWTIARPSPLPAVLADRCCGWSDRRLVDWGQAAVGSQRPNGRSGSSFRPVRRHSCRWQPSSSARVGASGWCGRARAPIGLHRHRASHRLAAGAGASVEAIKDVREVCLVDPGPVVTDPQSFFRQQRHRLNPASQPHPPNPGQARDSQRTAQSKAATSTPSSSRHC